MIYYKNGLITLARKWAKIGDVQKYIPIGWLGYSGAYVLYEVKTCKVFLEDIDVDGGVLNKPIADSLKELIYKLNIGK